MSKRPRQDWQLHLSPAAWKQFNALTYDHKQGVFDALQPVLEADNPTHAHGVKKLTDIHPAKYRVRARSHRIVFEVNPKPSDEDPPRWKGEVFILIISDRKDVY